MSYLTQSQENRPVAIAGVVAVHAGLAAVLLAGLAVKDVLKEEPDILVGHTFPDPPPPDPDIETPPKPEVTEFVKPIVTPITPVDLGRIEPINSAIIDPVIDPGPITLPPVDIGTGAIQAIEPARAIPRDPGRWVTDADYKSRWIREELFGAASFRLDVGANGRVSACMISRSTGHAALDKTTCSLITKRARFKPATDGTGKAVSGVYESSIRWVLPD